MDIVNFKKGGLIDRTIVSPAARKALKKKLGIKPDLRIGFLHECGDDGIVRVHVDIEGSMTVHEYETLKTFIEKM